MKPQLPDSNLPHPQFYSGLVNVQMCMHVISRVSAAYSTPGRRQEMDVQCNYSECQYITNNKIKCNYNSKSKYKMQVVASYSGIMHEEFYCALATTCLSKGRRGISLQEGSTSRQEMHAGILHALNAHLALAMWYTTLTSTSIV